jgi:hypothetical protein
MFYGWWDMKELGKYSINGKLAKILMDVERFHGTFQASGNLNPKFVTELKKTTVITSSGASTRIEGAILTDSGLKTLLKRLVDSGYVKKTGEGRGTVYIVN